MSSFAVEKPPTSSKQPSTRRPAPGHDTRGTGTRRRSPERQADDGQIHVPTDRRHAVVVVIVVVIVVVAFPDVPDSRFERARRCSPGSSDGSLWSDSQLVWRMLLAFGLVIVSKAAGLLAPLYFKAGRRRVVVINGGIGGRIDRSPRNGRPVLPRRGAGDKLPGQGEPGHRLHAGGPAGRSGG